MAEHPAGIVDLESAHDFSTTLKRLGDAFEKANLKIFARIDHSGAAEQVGLTMPRTIVLIYGSPRSGTPVMLETPAAALDLPLRVLVREDTSGKTIVAFHPAAAITNAVVLTSEQLARFSKAETLIASAIKPDQ
jgi:uncharacterized protein (DUF302 family)